MMDIVHVAAENAAVVALVLIGLFAVAGVLCSLSVPLLKQADLANAGVKLGYSHG